jgi:hypothetical protein
MKTWLNRLGQKVLGRSIHFHLFRNSSATFYCAKMNRQELCYRYGWRFSSPMPDRYINRGGAQSKKLDKEFKSTELSELKQELGRIKKNNEIKEDELKDMHEEMKLMAIQNQNAMIQIKQLTSYLAKEVKMVKPQEIMVNN